MRYALALGGLWLALIVVFVGLYQLFSSGSAPGSESRASALVPLLFLVFVALLTVFILRARRGANVNNEGIALLSQGRLTEALSRFEAARPALRRNPLIYMNLGVTRLALWQLEEAERELEAARKKRLVTNLSQLVVPQLALTKALQGQAASAHKWLEESKSLKNDASAAALLASAVLSCRAGDWTRARATLERQELDALGGSQRGLREALRAWTVEQTSGELRHVDAVSLFGETGPERLRAAWPEFVAFIDRAPPA
ncbi:MAG: hypothetical protein WBV82_17705 [Myxococcaceae bacterium]